MYSLERIAEIGKSPSSRTMFVMCEPYEKNAFAVLPVWGCNLRAGYAAFKQAKNEEASP